MLQPNYDILTRSYSCSMTNSAYILNTATMLFYRHQSIPQSIQLTVLKK